MAKSQESPHPFKHDGYDVVPDVNPDNQSVVGWRVPYLGSHAYSRKRDAIRAIKTRIPPEKRETVPTGESGP